MTSATQIFATTLGPMQAAVNEQGNLESLSFIEAPSERAREDILPECAEVVRQIQEYFQGRRQYFDLELDPAGTDFQKRVWAELCRVPFGQTLSYGELARRLGNPKAVRAVARANGANPICIVIPCHRIIGSDGSLTGYAYGLERKKRLLAMEGELPLFRK